MCDRGHWTCPEQRAALNLKKNQSTSKGRLCKPFHKQNLRGLTKHCRGYLIITKTETQEEGEGCKNRAAGTREAECQRSRGYVLTGRGRKKGSECLPGSQGDGRHTHRRGPTRSVKAWKGHVFSHGHTAGRRQSENSTQDQLGRDPMVSHSSVPQTFNVHEIQIKLLSKCRF